MGIFDAFKGKSDMEIAGDNQVDELDKGKVKEFDLNIEKILENWENYHAIREIIANALDEQVLTNTRDIEIKQAKDGWWHIVDYGRGLNYHHLTQNENEEKLSNDKLIGRFGVGLKDALATLYRHGVDVKIKSKYGIIKLKTASKVGFDDIIHFLRREMLDFTAFPVFFVSNLLLVQRKKYYFNRAMVSRNCSIVL